MSAAWLCGALAVALVVLLAIAVARSRRDRARITRLERDAATIAVLRRALAASQDAATVGSTTEAFVHGANNRMTVILSCLDVLSSTGLPSADSRRALELGESSARQLAHDLGALFAGIRRQPPEPRLLDIPESLAQARQVFAQLPGHVVDVRSTVPPGSLVQADAARFEATLVRLLQFARRRGATSVACTLSALEVESRATPSPVLKKGRYHCVEFELEGATIGDDLLRGRAEAGVAFDRMHDPDGLELAAAEAFAVAQRGRLVLDCATGASPRLQLYLPVAPAA